MLKWLRILELRELKWILYQNSTYDNIIYLAGFDKNNIIQHFLVSTNINYLNEKYRNWSAPFYQGYYPIGHIKSFFNSISRLVPFDYTVYKSNRHIEEDPDQDINIMIQSLMPVMAKLKEIRFSELPKPLIKKEDFYARSELKRYPLFQRVLINYFADKI